MGINYNSLVTVTISDKDYFPFCKNVLKLMNKLPGEKCFNLHVSICINGLFSLHKANN